MRDLAKDLEICQAATPEPWIVENAVLGDGARVTVIYSNRTTIAYLHRFTDEIPVNATFIIEAREALPYWLQRVKALEAQHEAATEALKRLRDLLPEFGGLELDRQIRRTIDDILAVLEGGEQA